MRLAPGRARWTALSPRSRRMLEIAQEEAIGVGAGEVGVEHLVLACLDGLRASRELVPDESIELIRKQLAGSVRAGIDAEALASIGIDLDEVRRCVEEQFGPGALERRLFAGCGDIRLGAAAKRTLALARATARRRVEPEGVLLAILRGRDEALDSLLTGSGIAVAPLRAALERSQSPGPQRGHRWHGTADEGTG